MEALNENKFKLIKENPQNNWNALASKGLTLTNFSFNTLESFEVKKEYQKMTTKSAINFGINVENYKKTIPYVFRFDESHNKSFILDEKNPLIASDHFKNNMFNNVNCHIFKSCFGVYIIETGNNNASDIGLYFQLIDDKSICIALESNTGNLCIMLGQTSDVQTYIKSRLGIEFSQNINLKPF